MSTIPGPSVAEWASPTEHFGDGPLRIPTNHYLLDAHAYAELPESAVPERYRAALPAYARYVRRERGPEIPAGRRDSAGRWYPAEAERRPCCARVPPPSRRFPLSLWTHCRTAGHCAQLDGVPPALLRGLIAWIAAYFRPAATAPDGLCPVCGASWACEHQPAPVPESELLGLASISVEEAQQQLDAQLAGRPLPGQPCARCYREGLPLHPALWGGLPRWLCTDCEAERLP